MSIFVRSSGTASPGTIYFIVSSPHCGDLCVRATIFPVNLANELGRLALGSELQLAIVLSK